MAIDFATACQFLDEAGQRYGVSPNERVIYIPADDYMLRVIIEEHGEGLLYECSNVFYLGREADGASGQCAAREAALRWIGRQVFETKIGHFGYSPETGEVDLAYFLTLEDGPSSSRQFMRIVNTMLKVARDETPKLVAAAYGAIAAEATGGEPAARREGNHLAGAETPKARKLALGESSPEGPCDEAQWLTAVVEFISQYASYPEIVAQIERRQEERDNALDVLVAARATSMAAGRRYVTAELAKAADLTDAQEWVCWFLYGRQALGDERIEENELRWLLGGEVREGLDALRAAGYVEAADGDDRSPWRLTRAYCDRLPGPKSGAGAGFDLNDVPNAPCNEARWQATMRALGQNLDGGADAAQAREFKQTFWPAMWRCRERSATAGESFASLDLARRRQLDTEAEGLLAYIAGCAGGASAAVVNQYAEDADTAQRLVDAGLAARTWETGVERYRATQETIAAFYGEEG